MKYIHIGSDFLNQSRDKSLFYKKNFGFRVGLTTLQTRDK